MIERQFIKQKIKEHQIQEYIHSQLKNTGYSHTEIKRTPLGEKVIVYTTRPGIVVGRKGDNIKKLTNFLKKKFKMDNPQIEIGEIDNPNLDVHFIADRIAGTLERFGSKRFKSTGYRMLQDILDAGALGAEIVISGKVPSSRARSWRFSAGYLKKSGDISESFVKKAYKIAGLKTGIIGIQVKIMTKDTPLPDKIILKEIEKEVKFEEIKQEKVSKSETKETKNKKQKNLVENAEELIDNVAETTEKVVKEIVKEIKKDTKKIKKETKIEMKKVEDIVEKLKDGVSKKK